MSERQTELVEPEMVSANRFLNVSYKIYRSFSKLFLNSSSHEYQGGCMISVNISIQLRYMKLNKYTYLPIFNFL